ncbi:hypothetical protein ES703_95585 [subsurface metagenome]
MMVADGLGAEASVRVAETTFIVAHNQQRFDAEVLCAFFHLSQIRGIVGLVLKEYVNILDRVDAKTVGLFCKIEVVQFRLLPAGKPSVKRPLSQRNLERLFRFFYGCLYRLGLCGTSHTKASKRTGT